MIVQSFYPWEQSLCYIIQTEASTSIWDDNQKIYIARRNPKTTSKRTYSFNCSIKLCNNFIDLQIKRVNKVPNSMILDLNLVCTFIHLSWYFFMIYSTVFSYFLTVCFYFYSSSLSTASWYYPLILLCWIWAF